MKDGCYGFPAPQKAVSWHHCPDCLRTWAFKKQCPICGKMLTKGEVPKPNFAELTNQGGVIEWPSKL